MEAVNIILCGSLSPITYAHLRTMEQARDVLREKGKTVKRGIISPVSDGYKKKDLVSAEHRANMIELAIHEIAEPWMEISKWEIEQTEKGGNPIFTPTRIALEEIQRQLDPEIPLLLLCGADMLESMNTPGVWDDKDVVAILSTGILVIERDGYNIPDIVENGKILSQFKDNITSCGKNALQNVSSTHIRSCIRNGHSIRYLTPYPVIQYINEHKLWINE